VSDAPSLEEIQKIIARAEAQALSDLCDHPCEYYWAKMVLEMALFIENLDQQPKQPVLTNNE
jgi:hypothetical protein